MSKTKSSSSKEEAFDRFSLVGGMQEFRRLVWENGCSHSRNDLPWRFVDDPYRVYVSEAMLQQTQVSRVLKYWPRFLSMFPAIDALASASTSDVLEMWQGLGYNRRALALKRAADECSARHKGLMPKSYDELVKLPGIGPATAAGIMAFAYQKPSVYIETNVRSVFIHHLFPDEEKVSDAQLRPLVEAACPVDRPREWYYALLDYGAYLKSTGVNPNRKSSQYSRQSAFEGSFRQKRSFILREVLAQPGISEEEVWDRLSDTEESAGRPPVSRDLFEKLLNQLILEGFFQRIRGKLLP